MPNQFDIGTIQPLNGGGYQPFADGITQPGKSTVADQFANAMGDFVPSVRRWTMNKQADISEEQTRQALDHLQTEQAKGEKTAAELVRSGDLALGANPYAQKAARQMFMRGLARKMGDEISADYETNPVRNADPGTVEAWAHDEFNKRAAKLGFNNPHDVDFLEGFAATKDSLVQGLVGYHVKQAAMRTERDLKEGISQDAAGLAESVLNNPVFTGAGSLDYKGIAPTDAAAQAIGNGTLKQALMTGMAPRDAYENVLDGLITKAQASGDASYLDVAEAVPTVNERNETVPMGQRVWAMEKIERVRSALAAQNAHAANREAEARKLQMKGNKDSLEGDLIGSLQTAKPEQIPTIIKGIQEKARGMAQQGQLEGSALQDLDKAADTFLASQKTRAEIGVGSAYESAPALKIINDIHEGKLVDFGQITAQFQDPALKPFYGDALKALAGTRDRAKGDGDFYLKSVLDGYTRKIDLTNPDNAKLLAQITSRFYSTMNLWRQQNPSAPNFSADPKNPSLNAATTQALNEIDKDYFGYEVKNQDGSKVTKDPFKVDNLENLYDTHVRIQAGIHDEAQKTQAQVDMVDQEIKQSTLAIKTFQSIPLSLPDATRQAVTQAEMGRVAGISNRLLDLAKVTGDAKAQNSVALANRILGQYFNYTMDPESAGIDSAVMVPGTNGAIVGTASAPPGSVQVPQGIMESDFQVLKSAGVVKTQWYPTEGAPGARAIEWISDPMKAAQVLSERALTSINTTSAPLRERAKALATKVKP